MALTVPADVDVEDTSPFLGGGLQQGLVGAHDTGGVDKNVDGPDLGSDLAKGGFVGDVGGNVGTAEIEGGDGEAVGP